MDLGGLGSMQYKKEGPQMYFSFWDFGGQEDYFQTHVLFLSPRGRGGASNVLSPVGEM